MDGRIMNGGVGGSRKEEREILEGKGRVNGWQRMAEMVGVHVAGMQLKDNDGPHSLDLFRQHNPSLFPPQPNNYSVLFLLFPFK